MYKTGLLLQASRLGRRHTEVGAYFIVVTFSDAEFLHTLQGTISCPSFHLQNRLLLLEFRDQR